MQFETLLTAARQSADRCDFALVAMLGLLGLHPTTAVKWMHEAGADWTRYAAELTRSRNHQPGE